MNFYQYRDSWDVVQKHPFLSQQFRDREAMWRFAKATANPLVFHQAVIEEFHYKENRPYYHLWPSILPMLLQFDLDVKASTLVMPPGADGRPLAALELRLPQDQGRNPLTADGETIRAMMIGITTINRELGKATPMPGLMVILDTGYTDPHGGIPVFMMRTFPLREDMTVEELLTVRTQHYEAGGLKVSEELVWQAIRIACCICLIGNDPDLLTPDVLAKDRPAWFEALTDPERRKVIEERARRRGKYGYDLGAELDVAPHVRRPHLAWVRHGKQWSQRKLVLRKGSIVHRSKLTDIPTDYEEPQE